MVLHRTVKGVICLNKPYLKHLHLYLTFISGQINGVRGAEEFLVAAGWRRVVEQLEPFYVLPQTASPEASALTQCGFWLLFPALALFC